MIVFEMFLLFTNVATYPSTGGRCKGSQVCLPREENAQSRHQHFFMENVEKTEMCGLRTLIMKGSRVVFTHGELISHLLLIHFLQKRYARILEDFKNDPASQDMPLDILVCSLAIYKFVSTTHFTPSTF